MRENVTACLLTVSVQKIISAKRKKKFRSERVKTISKLPKAMLEKTNIVSKLPKKMR